MVSSPSNVSRPIYHHAATFTDMQYLTSSVPVCNTILKHLLTVTSNVSIDYINATFTDISLHQYYNAYTLLHRFSYLECYINYALCIHILFIITPKYNYLIYNFCPYVNM